MIQPIYTCHATNFMLDLEPVNGDPKNGTMQAFIKNESNYDLAFCEAWNVVDVAKEALLTSSKDFLSLLDAVQGKSLMHLPSIKPVKSGFIKIHGRVDGHVNFFGLSKNANSNDEGIINIINKIWVKKKKFELIGVHRNRITRCFLDNKKFHITQNKEILQESLIRNEGSQEDTLKRICDILIPLYNDGLGPDGQEPIIVFHETSGVEREQEAIKIIESYFDAMKLTKTPEAKIREISILIQDLMQLHLYWDGNGRSLYMITNLLLIQNGLRPFYPKNMCMFDGNSVETMVQEVLSGQERFALMFGDVSQLSSGLTDYSSAVKELMRIMQTKFSDASSLASSFNERNLDLLFRRSAAGPKTIELLMFLKQNAKALNIDILSRGETSGSALDIARKFKNTAAVELLE